MKGDSGGISIAYGSIGLAYYYQKDYQIALEFFKKHLGLSEKRKDLWEISKVCNNIAQIYNSRGVFDSALFYQKRSLTLNREINFPSGEANISANLASTFLNLKQSDSAHWYINRAIDILSSVKQPVPHDYFTTYGNILQTQERYQQAVVQGLKAYNAARNQNLPLAVSDASRLLSYTYAKMGYPDLAYKYLLEHTRLKDSISNDEFLKQINRMEMQYDFQKKQAAAEYDRIQGRIASENKIKQHKTVLILLLPQEAISQKVKVNVKKKVVEETDNRANRKTDEIIDAGFDKDEEGIGNLFKKKDRKAKGDAGDESGSADPGEKGKSKPEKTKPETNATELTAETHMEQI